LVQIFLLDVKEQDRSQADGQVWKEDTQWARILDEGWDLERVKQVGAIHYADQGLSFARRVVVVASGRT
jgi:hypothetical protein